MPREELTPLRSMSRTMATRFCALAWALALLLARAPGAVRPATGEPSLTPRAFAAVRAALVRA